MPQVERARHSLRRRITFITLAIALAGIGAVSYYASSVLRDDMGRVLADQQFSTVSSIAAGFNSELEERISVLEDVARRIDRALLAQPDELQRRLDAYPGLGRLFNSGVAVVRRDGTAIVGVPSESGRGGIDYSDDRGISAALTQGRSVIGPPVFGRVLRRPRFSINVPVRTAQGEVIGAVFGVIDLAHPNFLDSVVRRNYGKSGALLLIDPASDRLVTGSDFSRAAQPLPEPGRDPALDKHRQGFLDPVISHDASGVEVLSSAIRLPVSGWLVVANLPTAEAFAPIRQMQWRIAAASLLLAVLAGAMSWRLLRREFEPLHSASEALARMSDDNLPPRPLPVAHQDEIGLLVGGFNRLLGKLAEREAQLEAERNFFSAVLQQASDGVLLADPADLRIREVNPSLCRMLGCTRAQLLGMTFHQALGGEREATGSEGRVVEIRRTAGEGAPVVLETVTTSLCDDGGAPHTILGIVRNISARRQVEEEQRRFIAMVSHEFRTPLATIDAAVQRLEAGEADAATRKRYRNIQNAVDRLVVLLDDYFTLDRLDLAGHGLHLSRCAPRTLLLDCQAVAQSLSSEHEVRVEAEALPDSFVCDADRMSLALHVLVDNAVNYTPPGSVIVLRGRRFADGGIEIAVTDDGPGIAQDELPHIFDKFFRGRAAAQQAGSGVGLYMARKVIAMHGGTLSACNRPEGGAEFRILLPDGSGR
jgi:PAS domain S-box-containing protein